MEGGRERGRRERDRVGKEAERDSGTGMKGPVWTGRNLPQAHGRGRLESWWILEPTAQGTHGCPLVDDW